MLGVLSFLHPLKTEKLSSLCYLAHLILPTHPIRRLLFSLLVCISAFPLPTLSLYHAVDYPGTFARVQGIPHYFE